MMKELRGKIEKGGVAPISVEKYGVINYNRRKLLVYMGIYLCYGALEVYFANSL